MQSHYYTTDVIRPLLAKFETVSSSPLLSEMLNSKSDEIKNGNRLSKEKSLHLPSMTDTKWHLIWLKHSVLYILTDTFVHSKCLWLTRYGITQ